MTTPAVITSRQATTPTNGGNGDVLHCRDRENQTAASWMRRYSKRHRPVRVKKMPAGVRAPQKVRIYRRHDHMLLQWWEPSAKRTNYLRVDGDLLDALSKAREIDERLVNFKRSGHAGRRLTLMALMERYLDGVAKRTDAGQLAVASGRRTRSALSHFRSFAETTAVASRYMVAHMVDREFVLAFEAWLRQRRVNGNGRGDATSGRPMASADLVLDVVRSMFHWAADPERGNLLPAGFINPFRRSGQRDRKAPRDPLGEPDVNIAMAAEFLKVCDAYQLRLFAPIILWGLRPTEAIWMFRENMDGAFLRHTCVDDLNYTTKGVRNKSLPLIEPLRLILTPGADHGLVLCRRTVDEGRERPDLVGKSQQELIEAYQVRCREQSATTATDRQRVRDQVLHDAGGLTYKMIQGEFARIAKQLGWPRSATLKDFRHLCQTALDNGGMTREERQYLMGQSLGTAAITAYIHINKLPEHYTRAVESEMAPILQVLRARVAVATPSSTHAAG